MIDCRATSCFIHPFIVKEYHLPKFNQTKLKTLKVIDSCEVALGLVKQHTQLSIQIANHMEGIQCHIADVGNHHLVLGMSWLKTHNPKIDWTNHTISFLSDYC